MRAACSARTAAAPSITSACTAGSTSRSARCRRRSASLGGYVAGNADLIDFLYHRARPFLFSTSHPPAVAAACIAALDVLMEEPEIIERLWDNTRFFKAGLAAPRVQHRPEREPDHPGHRGRGRQGDEAVGQAVRARACSRRGSRFPTVARDKARVRTIVTATHTREDLQFALDTFAEVGREIGLV